MNKFEFIINSYNYVLNFIKENKQYIIIVFWIFLIIVDIINITRLFYFCIIFCLIYIYKKMHQYNEQIFKGNKIFGIKLKLLKINKKVLYSLIYYIMKFYIMLNIILYLVIRIELLLYVFIEKKIYKNIIKSIIYLFLMPIKLLLSKFYQIIEKWKVLTIIDILFKRIYGLVFSVLICTNVIQYLILICGGYLYFFFLIYLILISICILYNKIEGNKKNINENSFFLIIYNKLNLDLNTLKLLERKPNINIICFFIKKLWEEEFIDKLYFINKYGKNLSFEWLIILNITSYKMWCITTKLSYINKHKINDIILLINKNVFLYDFLIYIRLKINRFLNYQTVLEFYNIYYIYKKEIIKDHIISEEYSKDIKILSEYNIKIIQFLLFFLCDIDKALTGKLNINHLNIKKDEFNQISFEFLDFLYIINLNCDNFNYIKNDTQLYQNIFDCILFLHVGPCIIENKILYEKYKYNKIIYLASFNIINIKTKKIIKMPYDIIRTNFDTNLEHELEFNLIKIKNSLIKKWLQQYNNEFNITAKYLEQFSILTNINLK